MKYPMTRAFVILIAGLTACGALSAPPKAETLRGQVKNGTPKGKPVSNLAVQLQTLDLDGKIAKVGETTTDARGKFSFRVAGDDKRYHKAIVPFGGAQYESSPVFAGHGHKLEPVTVMVFETASDATKISVDMHHVIIEPLTDEKGNKDADTWSVKEIIAMNNAGDRAYVGKEKDATGKSRTIRFSLPPGYEKVQPEEGLMECCTVITEMAMYDTMPMNPGQKVYVFSYQLPAQKLKDGWRRRVDYPTGQAMVVAKGDDIALSCPQLGPQKTTDLGQGTMTFVKGESLKAGTELAVKIKSADLGNPGGPLLIGTIVGLTLIFGLIAFAMRSKAKQHRTPAAGRTTASELPQPSRNDLLDRIADLDDQFEASNIEEAEYRKQRDHLKSQLERR